MNAKELHHIGIDATSLARIKTGLEVTVFEHLKALINIECEPILHIFYRLLWPNELDGLKHKKNIHLHQSSFQSQLMTEQFWLPWKIRQLNLDLVHYPAFPPSLFSKKPFILTIHDDVPWKYPETMSWKGKTYFKWQMTCAAKKAKTIITDTKFHQKTLKETFHLKNDPEVIPLAARKLVPSQSPLPQKIKKPYLLTVASLEPRKNLKLLVDTFINLKKTNRINHQLILVGRKAWMGNEEFNSLKQYEEHNEVVFTEYIEDGQLAYLYQNADLFILPSIYEGFGLTALEAIAMKCPVLSSDSSCLREVLGSGAEYFENNNQIDLQEKLINLIQNNELKEKIKKSANIWIEKYSWKKTAQNVLSVYTAT